MELTKWLSNLFGGGRIVSVDEVDHNIDKGLFYEILDTDPCAILFFTKENGWIGANKAFFNLVQIKSIEELKKSYESIRELFSDEDEEVFTEYDKSWLDYIRTHCPNGYGLGIVDAKGKRHAMSATSVVLKQGAKDFYLLRLEDKTSMVALKEEVVQVEALKTKFLANIGHEFRTPMNGILGFIELLSKTSPSDTQIEYIQSVQGSARNLMSNIENLLDLAQMQTGRLNISKVDFNIITEMEEFARGWASLGVDKGVGVLVFIDPKLPTHLNGDIRKIKQALSNLYNNALKFTAPEGRITIEIKLLKRNTNGSCNVGFSVKDTGKGINKNELGLITRPFVSGDHADNRLGVGLSLSHGLVNLMGGELKIASEEGRGSSFGFSLTLDGSSDQAMRMINANSAKVVLLDEKKLEDANHLTNYLRSFGISVTKAHLIDETIFNDTDLVYFIASQNKSDWILKLSTFKRTCKTVLLVEQNEKLLARTMHVIDTALSKPLLPTTLLNHLVKILGLKDVAEPVMANLQHGIRALVVEDNLINQRLIKLLLKEYGLNVLCTSNGDEAVEACRNQKFDIVFMDIDMPIKDGILATQEIKAEEGPAKIGRMPIIALTALAMEGDREYILEKGLDDYISKPLTREKLEFILQKYLHGVR
ncbi:MAG: response regulator [Sulfuricurvum sp.]|uniref:response regulator n=1 Tax=Sulfuricurvum sp. TaxID=2025608 RepID=UPI00261D1E55|nr:response regulator [Sulfuricurvum sp.]MDD2828559.1 response regulator [Sulfuricurvum sp.]MDD4948910.1 response regulator [Sulfuricurvum sp.]